MNRREFITLIGGAAVAWPFAARAQQPERVRRIGLLMGTAHDREGQARVTAFKQGLQELGWTVTCLLMGAPTPAMDDGGLSNGSP